MAFDLIRGRGRRIVSTVLDGVGGLILLVIAVRLVVVARIPPLALSGMRVLVDAAHGAALENGQCRSISSSDFLSLNNGVSHTRAIKLPDVAGQEEWFPRPPRLKRPLD